MCVLGVIILLFQLAGALEGQETLHGIRKAQMHFYSLLQKSMTSFYSAFMCDPGLIILTANCQNFKAICTCEYFASNAVHLKLCTSSTRHYG